ncbi:MAG: CZB domain-containing protein [Sulfurihydrogenibium sp.]|uniref:CZB domain-containing protein n=1 Tax=Sulfurihydrogenibium sp. TaxID=2053621 RepID=UPI003C7A4D5F
MVNMATSSVEEIKHFKHIAEEFERQADLTSRYTTYIADVAFLAARKLDHIIFKNNTYSSIAQERLTFKFTDHYNCDLGKWYYSDNSKEFKNFTVFKALEEYHKNFHEALRPVVQIIEKGEDIVKYKNLIIQKLNEAELNSAELFKMIDSLAEERKKSLLMEV